MNLKNQLGKRIQDLRKAQKLTQEMLAEKINIDITSLSKICRLRITLKQFTKTLIL